MSNVVPYTTGKNNNKERNQHVYDWHHAAFLLLKFNIFLYKIMRGASVVHRSD